MTSPSAHATATLRGTRSWLPEIALLLATLGTRAFRLTELPPHIDEVFHVYRARDVWTLHPLYFINTTKLLNVWLIALFYPFASPYWAARIVSVFSSLVTTACVYKLGQLLYNRGVGLVAGFLYLILPLTFWYDRIALSDPISTATGALILLASILFVRRPTWRYAALVGLTLAIAYLSKVTMLGLWPVPVLAWLLLASEARLRRAPLVRLIGAYALGLALIAPVLFYAWRYSDLGLGQVGSRVELDMSGTSLVGRLLRNGGQLLTDTRTFVGLPAVVWLLAAPLVAIATRKGRAFFLLGAALLPIGALMALGGNRTFTRYYLIGLPPLLILMGASAALAWDRLRRILPDQIPPGAWSLAGGALLLGLAATYLPFFRGTYTDIAGLSLPPLDYETYVSDYPAGFGWDASSERLRQIAAASEQRIVIVAPVEGHAWRTRIALTGVPGVDVLQPEPLEADSLSGYLTGDVDLYFIREEPRPEIDWAALGVTAERVETFPKPGGHNWVELRRLTPAESETRP